MCEERPREAYDEWFPEAVLNVFGYTGGFSVYAMQGGAKLVHSVDSSKKAIYLTNENIELNFEDTTRHESFAVDAFEYLNNIKEFNSHMSCCFRLELSAHPAKS